MNLRELLLVVTLFPLFVFSQVLPVEYQIIPRPQSVSYGSGELKLGEKVKLFFSPGLEKEAELLNCYLASGNGIKMETVLREKIADIVLRIDLAFKSEKPEGYRLETGKNSISITSDSPQGVFNGIQSLRQIIRKNEKGFTVQRGVIEDYPAFAWRSFMLDEARHFKGKEVVKQLLDEMALLKMNIFHWHLVDDQGWRIEIKKYPLLTEVGSTRDSTEVDHFHSNRYDGKPHSGYYTQDEIREIVAFAADRNIMIVPEIEMPGHSSAAIASYPWLGTSGLEINVPCKFGVQYDIYNVADHRVFAFFNDVFDEIITLFPSPVIHIGGDEPRYDQWNASDQVKTYMAANGLNTPAELLVFFTNNISEMLKTKEKRMMGWNEITGDRLHDYHSDADTKGLSQKLAEGAIVHFWKGDIDKILNTIIKGYDVVNSNHSFTYLDYNYKSIPLSKAYSFNPIPEGLPEGLEEKVLGMGCQMWGEFIPTLESMNRMVYPRLAAYAECGWTNNDQKDYYRFLMALPAFLERWKNAGINYGPVE